MEMVFASIIRKSVLSNETHISIRVLVKMFVIFCCVDAHKRFELRCSISCARIRNSQQIFFGLIKWRRKN